MKTSRLKKMILTGEKLTYPKGQVIYALDFKAAVYVIKDGYVGRYSLKSAKERSVQSIYGPGYFFPLSPVFSYLLGLDINEETSTYVYGSLTDVEIYRMDIKALASAVKQDPLLYADLLYEAGKRFQSNIQRLENVALDSDYKKVAHHLAYLAEEYGATKLSGFNTQVRILPPLTVADVAEQLSITTESAEEAIRNLVAKKYISVEDGGITVNSITELKDVYL